MRRFPTVLVVGGVLLLAALAAADALRGHGDPDRAPAATTTRPKAGTALSEKLRRKGVSDRIVYSDEQCLVHTLLLPELEDVILRRGSGGVPIRSCLLASGGDRFLFLTGDELISPDGARIARCRRGHVEVLAAVSRRLVLRVPGCAPAWRPDGALTYVRGGEIFVDGGPLLSRRDLFVAATEHSNVPSAAPRRAVEVDATALAWFDDERLAVVLRIRSFAYGFQYVVVVFDGARSLAAAQRFGGPSGRLLTSPDGSLVVTERGVGIGRDGVGAHLPEGLPPGRFVAFSPDGRWLAFLSRGSMYLVATPRNEGTTRTIQLPFAAIDAAWERLSPGTSVGPPIRR
jgi:hypothetical protein